MIDKIIIEIDKKCIIFLQKNGNNFTHEIIPHFEGIEKLIKFHDYDFEFVNTEYSVAIYMKN